MRKPALPLLACVLIAAAAPAPSFAAPTVKLKVAFEPNRIGARTTILFGFDIAGPYGGAPSPIMSLDLRLPAHMGIATPTLRTSQLLPRRTYAGRVARLLRERPPLLR